MIDEKETLRRFGYRSVDLAPKSQKRIVVVCDVCGKVREVGKYQYRKLCHTCKMKDPATRKKISKVHKGKKHSEETKKKISAAGKGRTFSEESRKKIGIAHKGKITSAATKEKISKSHKGKKLSAEHRRKIGKASKGKTISKEHRKKLSIANAGKNNAMYGKYPSDETRKKISAAGKGRQCSDVTKKKLSIANAGKNNANYGKSPSDETRKKIGKALKGKIPSKDHRIKVSAGKQGIPPSEWKEFARETPYCGKFNNSCREHNREKHNRECFICGKPESKNLTKTGKARKLSVHHVDRNKNQGCDGTDWALVPLCLEHHGSSHSKLWQSRIAYLLSKEKKR